MNSTEVTTIFANTKCEKSNYFELFNLLNSTRHSNHSINKVCLNNEDKIFVGRCNCGKKIYHPILGDEVIWGLIISPKNLALLRMVTFEKAALILQD